MIIVINGERQSFAIHTLSIAEWLASRNIEPKFCAIELNGEIVSQRDFDSTFLKDGDEVELVTLVGGG